MPYPADRRYTTGHIWILPTEGGRAQVGITDVPLERTDSVLAVEVPPVGTHFGAGDEFGTLESAMAVIELFAPLDCTIAELNDTLRHAPEEISLAYYSTWITVIQMAQPKELEGLLTAAQYDAYVAGAR
ncbi:glycine cleavage system protein H [Streptomyces sp. NPDC054865]